MMDMSTDLGRFLHMMMMCLHMMGVLPPMRM